MRCWDCGAYKQTAKKNVGRCSEKQDPGGHPDGGLVYGSSHECSKWYPPVRVCCVCSGVYDENGLTGEIWDGRKPATHGYCPGCKNDSE